MCESNFGEYVNNSPIKYEDYEFYSIILTDDNTQMILSEW